MTKTPLATKFLTLAVVVLAVASLTFACMPVVAAYSEGLAKGSSPDLSGTPAVYEKTEVVYATLSADGSLEAAYVVNQFDVEKAGDVEDLGSYEKVINITDESPIAYEGDAASFAVGEGAFYYQGNMSAAQLPWDVSLSYQLDGEDASPEELAGKSGLLSMNLTTKPNPDVDASFAESYMLQVTFTLNGDKTTDIQADGATLASSGRDRTVAFTVLPGKDADCTLTAQVREFEMAGVQIAALPYAMDMEMPDTQGMLDDMEKLTDAIKQLDDGADSLASGVRELAGGADEFASGAAGFGEGLQALEGSSAQLVSGSGEIKGALDAIAAGLAGAGEGQVDLSGLAQLGQLSGGLRSLAGAFDGLALQVQQLQAGFDSAHAGLAGAIAAIPEPTLGEAEIGELVASTYDENQAPTALTGTATTLAQTYQAAQVVKGTYESPEFQQLVGSTSALLSALGADAAAQGSFAYFSAALTQIADGIDSAPGADSLAQLAQLAAGLGQLAENYGSFHAGLEQYAAGVGQLSSGYEGLVEGASDLADGTSQLASGASELADGTGELASETADMPDTMQEEIDSMMEDYDFPEWEPVSFTSAGNEHTVAVQFVMITDGIEIPEEPEAEEEPEEELGIIERFLALFE